MSATTTRRNPMTRKRRRLYAVLAGLTMLGVATGSVLFALEDSVVFFFSPTDLTEKELRAGQHIRVGGLVEEGSYKKGSDGITHEFVITDLSKTVKVRYKGLLPDLFRPGQGVVTGGKLGPDGVFVASEVLAKHDENYMPPEVADALKKSGKWKEQSK